MRFNSLGTEQETLKDLLNQREDMLKCKSCVHSWFEKSKYYEADSAVGGDAFTKRWMECSKCGVSNYCFENIDEYIEEKNVEIKEQMGIVELVKQLC